MIYKSRHISISINRPASQVYAFASDPENLPRWASGLSTAVRREGHVWIADSPMGEVRVTFADKNEFGVLDHEVTLPTGEKVYNPLRIFPNGNGCEVVFTLYWLPGRTEEEFEKDTQMVKDDLDHLKNIMIG